MGEDNFRSVDIEKKSGTMDQASAPRINGDSECNGHHHSSVSSSSEGDSESMTYAAEEEGSDQDYQYGPGIVSKLRTKFLSITLKQSRGQKPSMRRSCSLEDILGEKTSSSRCNLLENQTLVSSSDANSAPNGEKTWHVLKRAKSMDTLLLSVTIESTDLVDIPKLSTELNGLQMKPIGEQPPPTREPKMIKRKDGPLTRLVVAICDEELPKPDTVKTYKRMFEPAESKKANVNSNVRRKPPVLRASAKSSSSVSSTKSVSQAVIVKANGVTASSPTICKDLSITKPTISAKVPKLAAATPAAPTSEIANTNHYLKKEPNVTKIAVENLILKEIPVAKKRINHKLSVEMPHTKSTLQQVEIHKSKHRAEVIKNFRPPTKSVETTDGFKPKIPDKKIVQKSLTSTIAQAYEEALEFKSPVVRPAFRNEKIPVKTPPLHLSHSKLNGQHVINNVKTDKKIDHEADEKPKQVTVANTSLSENKFACNEQQNVSSKAHSIQTENHQLLQVKKAPVKSSSDSSPAAEPSEVEHNKQNEEVPGKDPYNRKAVIANLASAHNTMVFDFRGKDVVSHLAVVPPPFGCRTSTPSDSKSNLKKRTIVDGSEFHPQNINGFTNGCDSEDEELNSSVDYSVPPPCGVIFVGENVRVGKGSMLTKRNKELKIQFDEDVEKNTFIYPSESSLLVSDESSSISDISSLEDNPSTSSSYESAKFRNPSTKLRPELGIGSTGTGGLMSYTPSVLRTVENFQPGQFRHMEKEDKKKNKAEPSSSKEGDENRDQNEDEMLKPADPDLISSWSLSANTSDLLF